MARSKIKMASVRETENVRSSPQKRGMASGHDMHQQTTPVAAQSPTSLAEPPHNSFHSGQFYPGMMPSLVGRGVGPYSRPYLEYAASVRSSVSVTPRHSSVAPASESVSRKKPRVLESPMMASSSSYFSPHDNSICPNAPPGRIMMSSPISREQIFRQSSGYSFPSSSYLEHSLPPSPASAMIPEHFASGGRNEPWIADIGSQPTVRRLSVVPASDFDPYNEEILSDHSDQRDGSISPIIFPKRGD